MDGKSAKTSATRNCLYGASYVSLSPPTCFYDPFWVKNRGYIQLHHIGSFLLHLFLLICHQLHPFISCYIIVPAIFSLGAVNLERQGAPKCIVTYACTIAKTAPLLSKPRDKSNGVFSRTVLAALRFT